MSGELISFIRHERVKSLAESNIEPTDMLILEPYHTMLLKDMGLLPNFKIKQIFGLRIHLIEMKNIYCMSKEFQKLLSTHGVLLYCDSGPRLETFEVRE